MRSSTLFVLFAITLGFIVAVAQAGKTSSEPKAARVRRLQLNTCTNCLPGDNCCPDLFLGSTCYNPTTHHCVNIQGTAQNRLCSINDKACSDGIAGKTCYDPSRYDCVAVEGFQTPYLRLCPKGFKACGASYTCYDPAHYSCCNGSVCGK